MTVFYILKKKLQTDKRLKIYFFQIFKIKAHTVGLQRSESTNYDFMHSY